MKTHSKNKSWCRYLGTTPDSSSLAPLLTSICQQLSYTFMLPFEDIPDDLVPLTAHMKELLNQVYAHSGDEVVVSLWGFQLACLGDRVPTAYDLLGFGGPVGRLSRRKQDVVDADQVTSPLQNHCFLHKVLLVLSKMFAFMIYLFI